MWFLLACLSSTPDPEKPKSPTLLTEEQQADAAIQASRSAPVKGEFWSGPWKASLWAADITDPEVQSLAQQLSLIPQEWDGKSLRSKRGEVALLFASAKELPRQPMGGEVVFILQGSWSDKEIAALPWLGGAIVHPEKVMGLFASEQHLKDPDLFAGVAAWQIATHYKLDRKYLTRPVPLGLRSILSEQQPEANAPDPRERAAAAEGSTDPEMVVRLQTAGKTKEQHILSILTKDIDPWVRARAFDSLDAIDLLNEGLRDPSSVNRVIAAHRLAVLASQGSQEALPSLERAASSPDAYVRWKAAYGLSFGSDTRVLIELLKDVDIDVQRQAAQALQKIGDLNSMPALIEATESQNSFVRRWALEALGSIDSPDVIPVLQHRYQNSQTILEKEAAATALHRRGVSVVSPPYQPPPPPRSEEDIRRLVASKDATVRKDTAKFLAGRKGMEKHLQKLAADEDSEVRKSAVEAMGWNSYPQIYEYLSDPDPDVLITALDGIRRSSIGNGEGLLPLLEHSDAEVRLRATQALAGIETLSSEQRSALQEKTKDLDERIRMAALSVLPEYYNPAESSAWVRREVEQLLPAAQWNISGVMTTWTTDGDSDQKAWLNGIVQFEDDLLHQRFSWNDERDRPLSHQRLRPPLFRPYGHPDRG